MRTLAIARLGETLAGCPPYMSDGDGHAARYFTTYTDTAVGSRWAEALRGGRAMTEAMAEGRVKHPWRGASIPGGGLGPAGI